MRDIRQVLEWLSGVSRVSLTLLDDNGNLLCTWPNCLEGSPTRLAGCFVVESFRSKERDARHPMISFIEPGFLLGVVELNPERYVLIGLVSPYTHTREEILKTIGDAIFPDHRSRYCDFLLQQPLMSLEQVMGYDLPSDGFVRNRREKRGHPFCGQYSCRKAWGCRTGGKAFHPAGGSGTTRAHGF